MTLLSIAQINEGLSKLNNWELEENGKCIIKRFSFENFKTVIGFVNKVAEAAENEGHHPDLRIFQYNNLEIKITTHSVDGLTQKDFDLAKSIDEIETVGNN